MKSTGLYTADCIRTFTGKYVNVFDPDPDTICIEDIAHSLAHQCRFGGHTNRFYSVAEHCVLMALSAPDQLKLDHLLHDAAEAYLIDLPRPIKRRISEYSNVENNLLATIAKKFSFACPLHESVKQIDEIMLLAEWHALMQAGNPLDPFACWDPVFAKKQFLELYSEIAKSHRLP